MDKYYKANDGMFWQPPKNEKDYIWRYDGNPIFDLKKLEDVWHICNSAVVMENGEYIGIFRIEDKSGCPMLVVGRSKNGVDWELEPNEIDWRNEDGSVFEKYYSYDPRLIKIEGKYYVVFCADVYDDAPCIYIAETTDFKKFTMLPQGFLPMNRNGVLFPEKINGKYYMLNRPCSSGDSNYGKIFISESPDMIYWGKHKLLSANRDAKTNYWERKKIGAGPAPIKTDEGWLLIYHGVQATISDYTYSFGVMLLDLNDPTKVLYKAKRYLLTPEEDYERSGFCDNVCFPCAALCDSEGKVTIYYGVVDTNMAIAFTTVDKLLEFVKKYN